MNRETLIFELLKTFNQGSDGYLDQRVGYATEQADKLIEEINVSKIHNDNKFEPSL